MARAAGTVCSSLLDILMQHVFPSLLDATKEKLDELFQAMSRRISATRITGLLARILHCQAAMQDNLLEGVRYLRAPASVLPLLRGLGSFRIEVHGVLQELLLLRSVRVWTRVTY